MLVTNSEANSLEASTGTGLAARSSRKPSRLRRLLRLLGGEEGGSLVEMTMTLPILLTLVTGMSMFGITINHYLQLTNATNIAALQLAIARGQTTDPCALFTSAFEAAAPYLNPASATITYTLNGTGYSGTTCSSASTTTGAAGNLVQGASAVVHVTYPCTLSIYNFAPSCTLNAQVTELIQ